MNIKKPILSLVKEIAQKLSTAYPDPLLCEQYAWWTLESILGVNQATLLAHPTFELSGHHEKQLAHWLDQLINHHQPIQYLIGSVPFGNLDILVKPPTLIPRPETEEWCLWLIEQLKSLQTKNLTIIDIGSGTGCIALSLAYAFPHATVYAVDCSDSALELTLSNIRHTGVKNITVIKSDVFDTIAHNLHVDLIVSNPPYIAYEEWSTLDASVKQWEDKGALLAPDNGLAVIQKIIIQATRHIRTHPALKSMNIPQVIIEIGYKQADAVMHLMKVAHYNNIGVRKDLEGKDRIVFGRIDHVAITAHTQ